MNVFKFQPEFINGMYMGYSLTKNGQPIDIRCLVAEINRYVRENQLLREQLKNEYVTQICENCIYCEYLRYEVPGYPDEYDSRCLKGHTDKGGDKYGEEVHECNDFELKITGGEK